jgi:hypothetical protein
MSRLVEVKEKEEKRNKMNKMAALCLWSTLMLAEQWRPSAAGDSEAPFSNVQVALLWIISSVLEFSGYSNYIE